MRHRNVIAKIRQLTGRRYEALEHMLELGQFDDRQARELARLLEDVREAENRRMRSQATRMGLPGVIR